MGDLELEVSPPLVTSVGRLVTGYGTTSQGRTSVIEQLFLRSLTDGRPFVTVQELNS